MVQLTSDKRRPDAIGFYESPGFVPSHEELKLDLHPRHVSARGGLRDELASIERFLTACTRIHDAPEDDGCEQD